MGLADTTEAAALRGPTQTFMQLGDALGTAAMGAYAVSTNVSAAEAQAVGVVANASRPEGGSGDGWLVTLEAVAHVAACVPGFGVDVSSAAPIPSCVPCEPGTEQLQVGMLACTPCAAGHAGNGSGACLRCAAGEYAPAGSSECAPCAPGHVSREGAVSCTPCAIATYVSAAAFEILCRLRTASPSPLVHS